MSKSIESLMNWNKKPARPEELHSSVSNGCPTSGMCCGLLLFLLTTSLTATEPRVTLSNYEKDLGEMAHVRGKMVCKEGSFISRVAKKREQKEALDEECESLKKEIQEVQEEVSQFLAEEDMVDQSLTEEHAVQCSREQECERLANMLQTEQERLQSS